MNKKKRSKWILWGVLGSAAVVAPLSLGSFFRLKASLPDNRLVKVQRGDLALSVVATGSVMPTAIVELKSKASGLVKRILVEEGERIRPGQVLIELDKELLQAQLREAEANRMAVEARLQEAEAEAESARSRKQKIELDVNNLMNRTAFYRKQVDRYRALSQDQLIAHSELEAREREYQEALFQTEALRSELMMQEAHILAAEKAVARMRAEVSQAEAVLDRVRENLRYATITSPIDGRVLKRHVEVGDAVSSILQLGSQATLLMTLGDMSRVFVEGRVDETDVGKVYLGQKARVKVDAFRDRFFPGEVMEIAPLGEEKDNVIGFEVKVSISDPEGILKAKMSANAEIIIQEKKQVLLIPESAVIYNQERNTFADMYDPSVPELTRRVPIQVGISNGTVTEVESGLEERTVVVRPEPGGPI